MLAAHGWTLTPLLPISSAQVGAIPVDGLLARQKGVVQVVLDALGIARNPEPPALDPFGSSAVDLLKLPDAELVMPDPNASTQPAAADYLVGAGGSNEKRPPASPDAEMADAAQECHADALRVCLLGSFDLQVNGGGVQNWTNSKGRAVFKYLACHHAEWNPREVLMETFWPDSLPESSRNNLNVALHNVRSMLASQIRPSAVLYQQGAYRLHPDLRLWLDIEVFEQLAQDGQTADSAGQSHAAIDAFTAAVELYRGDFLADDPYEGWAVPLRERLRILHLDTLDRLSQLHYGAGDYSACIALCQRMLDHDNCREDAHSRLMRCYHRIGQDHQALRQYQLCVEALRNELDVTPATETEHLYEHIRAHESI